MYDKGHDEVLIWGSFDPKMPKLNYERLEWSPVGCMLLVTAKKTSKVQAKAYCRGLFD